MNAKCYFDECKEKLGLDTNYKLAIALNINVNMMNFYYASKRLPDEYACFKIAECLEVDPAIVIAEIKAESEKNPVKREYFKSFHGALRKAGVTIMLALALSLSLLSVQNAGDTSKSILVAGLFVLGGTALTRFRYFA